MAIDDLGKTYAGGSNQYPQYWQNTDGIKVVDAKNEIKNDFSPVGHDDIEKLNASLEQARKFSTGNNQEKLATVLILVNHVEYLTKNILKNLKRMIKISAYISYNGTIFWPTKEFKNTRNKDIDKFTLGEIKEELNQFNFPDKEDFLRYLNIFNQKRISLVHELLDQSLVKDLQIEEVLNIFNNIFLRYKIILSELIKKWPIKQ